MVIGILGILTGIVTTAASGAMKNARTRRTDALCTLVQTGLATYYAKKDKWPDGVGLTHSRSNYENNGNDDPDVTVLSGSEVRKCIREMVLESKNGAVMDVSGLFVSQHPGKYGDRFYGMDFVTARKGTRKNRTKMSVSSMYFGYPDPETGYFRHFKIVYSIPTDTMTVSKMDSNQRLATAYE